MFSKTRLIIAGVIVLLLVVVFDQIRRQPGPDEEMQNDATQSIVVDKKTQQHAVKEWKEFHAPLGAFQVLLPALPQHAQESVALPSGRGLITYEMYLAQDGDGSAYMISLVQYPQGFDTSNARELLQGVKQEMVQANPKNILKEDRSGQFQLYPALDFLIENNGIYIRSTCFLAGKTLYVLTMIDSSLSSLPPRFEKFAQSFKIGDGN